MDRLLTVEEIAELLGVKKSTVYAWVSEGYMPHCKVGKCLRFREKTVEAWVESKETSGRKQRRPVDSRTEIGYLLRQ